MAFGSEILWSLVPRYPYTPNFSISGCLSSGKPKEASSTAPTKGLRACGLPLKPNVPQRPQRLSRKTLQPTPAHCANSSDFEPQPNAVLHTVRVASREPTYSQFSSPALRGIPQLYQRLGPPILLVQGVSKRTSGTCTGSRLWLETVPSLPAN